MNYLNRHLWKLKYSLIISRNFVNLVLAMKTNQLKKELIVESITKLVKDKELVRSYIKGQISLQALKDEGIKFGRPL